MCAETIEPRRGDLHLERWVDISKVCPAIPSGQYGINTVNEMIILRGRPTKFIILNNCTKVRYLDSDDVIYTTISRKRFNLVPLSSKISDAMPSLKILPGIRLDSFKMIDFVDDKLDLANFDLRIPAGLYYVSTKFEICMYPGASRNRFESQPMKFMYNNTNCAVSLSCNISVCLKTLALLMPPQVKIPDRLVELINERYAISR
jgi:hypothetical protein